MAIKTRAQLLVDLVSKFPSNTAGAITAEIYRGFITDVLDSASFGIVPELQSTSFTISNADQDGMMYAYSGANSGVATLNEASTFAAGHFFLLYRSNAQITLNPSGSDTINGSTNSIPISIPGNMLFVIKMSDTAWLALTIVNDFSAIVDGYVPISNGEGNMTQSSIRELTDRILFTKSIEVPGGSVLLAGSQRLSAGTRCLILENTALSEMGLVHPDPYSDTGSSTPKYRKLDAIGTEVRQPLNNVNSPATPYSFTFTMPENNFITGLRVDANGSVQGSFTVRLTDENGGVLAESGMVNLVDGINDIPLPNGMVLNNGDILHITVEGDTSGGGLKGGTVNSVFVPFFATTGHDFTPIDLDYPNDLINAVLQGTNAIRFTRRDGKTFDISMTGGGVYHAPTIHNFSIPGLASRITTSDSLAGDHTANFEIDNLINLSAAGLNVDVNGTVVHTFAKSALVEGANNLTFNISTSEWSTITTPNPTSLAFKLTGVDTNSDVVNSANITVTRGDIQAQEYVYDGLSNSNNPDTVDISGFDQTLATTGQHTLNTGTTTQNQYYIILVPTDHDITDIQDTVLQQSVLDVFTKTVNVRQIGGVNYNSFVIGPLNAGGNEDYLVTLS